MTELVVRPWGPVLFHLAAATTQEAAWFADHYTLSSISMWPERTQVRIRTVIDSALLANYRSTVTGPADLRIRDELYHDLIDDGPVWVRAGARPADVSTPPLPEHAFRRAPDGWTVVSDGAAGSERLSEILARLLLVDTLVAAGGVVLHASAGVVDGRSTVFLGGGEAGKTTLALHATRSGGLFVAGDQTVLLPGDDRWTVGAALMPRLRWGTLDGLGLSSAVQAARLRRYDLGARPVSALQRRPHKVVLTQAELSAVLGVATTDAGRLARLVFVERCPGAPLQVTALDPGPAAVALAEHMLRPAGNWPPRPVGRGPLVPADITETVPVAHVRWDPTVHSAIDVLRSIGHRATAASR